MEGLTAYVKFSMFHFLIEDNHPFVLWEVGVTVNYFSACNFRRVC